MFTSAISALSLAASLLVGGAPAMSSELPELPEAPAQSVEASAAEAPADGVQQNLIGGKKSAALAAIQEIEDAQGHDLVNLEFDEDGGVLVRPVDTFDEEADAEAMTKIFRTLRELNFESISAVGKPLYVEAPALDLPEIDPEYSHVVRG